MSQITTTKVDIEVAGKPVSGYLATPQDGGPGVIVLHAWWGLNPFFQEFCKRLAAQGFTAFAPDLNQGKVAQTIEAAEEILGERLQVHPSGCHPGGGYIKPRAGKSW